LHDEYAERAKCLIDDFLATPLQVNPKH